MVVLFLFLLFLSPQALDASGTEDMQKLVLARCTECHNSYKIYEHKRIFEQWQGIMEWMVEEGAQVSPAESEQITQFLTDALSSDDLQERRKALLFSVPSETEVQTSSKDESPELELVPIDQSFAAPQMTVRRYTGLFHPLFVHFPIALILVLALWEFVRMRQNLPIERGALHNILLVTSVLTLLSVISGIARAPHVPPLSLLYWHKSMGLLTALCVVSSVSFRMAVLTKPTKLYQALYYISLFLAAACVGLTGHLGGKMTFGILPF